MRGLQKEVTVRLLCDEGGLGDCFSAHIFLTSSPWLRTHCSCARACAYWDREVASLALYLASDEASFATGAAYALDGGVCCRM
jgi:hypothetical protein